ncbi:MAG: DUF4062 domain-containing protein [Ignavibacteriaceae bacterium]|nr:DUF4062 domain-containing protein [Ignavibacteriaceae bacterium]
MDISSEYAFPIFISSTDYNLKDLRAELARFLSELGYRPFLSSAEGFPDSSPILEPWESCLPVLDKCFVMVLIIDGNYGTPLNWPNFKEYFNEDKYSPTHGEYLFGHKTRKRMLVFIRKSLMPHYQSYRTVLDNCKNDKDEAKKILTPTLPSYVSFETLEFINKVKTTKPIPWINEFDDITSVKKEIQRKMLNELAELFLIKNKHFETVIDSFNKLLDSLSLDEQKKALSKINATKEILDAVEKLEGYKSELEQSKTELEKTKSSNSKDKDKFEKKINSLNKKISELEFETLHSPNSQFFIKDGQVQIGNPNYLDSSYFTISPSLNLGSSFRIDSENILTPSFLTINHKTCDGCGKVDENPSRFSHLSSITFSNYFNTCPICNRYLCSDCWPKNNYFLASAGLSTNGVISANQTNKCPKCVTEGK